MNRPGLRRALHALSGAVALLPEAVGWNATRLALGALLAVAIVSETLRLRSPRVRDGLARAIPVFRRAEAQRPSGATWLALAYFVCAWFPPPAAVAGFLAAAWADPAASLVGGRWGGGRPKSWIGSAATALVTAAVAVGLGAGGVAIPLALAAAAAERWSGPIDDNLLVGPVTAVVWILLLGGS